MSVFLISIKGQIEKATFPDHPELFIKYQFVYGDDWIVTSGIEEGITQICKRYDTRQDFIFNFPLDVTFKSTNPRGWPQIVLCAYGKDTWGSEVIRGYGVSFIPLSLGSNLHKTVGMFVPDASNLASKFSTLISGRPPELFDPRILARNRGREVLRTTSKGCIHLTLNLISKDTQLLSYSLGSNDKPPTVTLPERGNGDQLRLPSTSTMTDVSNQFNSLLTSDRGDQPQPDERRNRRGNNRQPAVVASPSQPALSPRVTVVRRLQEEKELQQDVS